jgi:hypothetical protein
MQGSILINPGLINPGLGTCWMMVLDGVLEINPGLKLVQTLTHGGDVAAVASKAWSSPAPRATVIEATATTIACRRLA